MRRLTLIPTTIVLVALAAVLGNDMLAIEMPDNLPRALEAQRALVTAHPDHPSAFNDLGNLLVLAGDLDSAEDAYRRAVELSPHEPAYRYNLALLLQQRGAFKKAAEQYRQVVELTPGNAWAHFQLGVIYEVKGLSRKAIASYGRALQLDAGLAFPDVNPSVIESDLLTEAMLRGYHRGLSVPQAPRVYREPQRIASLLIELPEEGGSEAMPEGLEPAAEEADAEESAGAVEGAAEESSAAADRTLSGGDLSDRPVNQASPQGRAGYRPPGSRPSSPRSVRTWRPPSEEEQGQQENQPSRTGRRQAAPQGGTVIGIPNSPDPSAQPDDGRSGSRESPGTGRQLVPGRRTPNGVESTGRLEMVLEPPASEQPA